MNQRKHEYSNSTNQDNLTPYKTIVAASAASLETVDNLRIRLAALHSQLPELSCVLVCGSLARLDASEVSDADLIVVLKDEAIGDSAKEQQIVSHIWNQLVSLGLEPPQGDGIFATPISRSELCDGPCGVVAEDVGIFGKRIHLLLESRSVFGDDTCRELQRTILTRYASHPFSSQKGEYWKYLTDDLIRYWRSYSVWRHWDMKTSAGGWYMRNAKLRHSRLLTYASLLLVCVVDEMEQPSIDSLLKRITQTPLERLQHIDEQFNADTIDEICFHYDAFLGSINDSTFRQRLETACPSSAQNALQEAPSGFIELLDNSDKLRAALVKIVQSLPDAACDRALQHLLF